jgi:hypothetical protein
MAGRRASRKIGHAAGYRARFVLLLGYRVFVALAVNGRIDGKVSRERRDGNCDAESQVKSRPAPVVWARLFVIIVIAAVTLTVFFAFAQIRVGRQGDVCRPTIASDPGFPVKARSFSAAHFHVRPFEKTIVRCR